MKKKYSFVAFLFVSLTLCSSLFAQPAATTPAAPAPATVDDNQMTLLEAQAQKLIDEYAVQKKLIEDESLQKTAAIGNSPDDRLKRKNLMVETNFKLRNLQDNFKVNLDSIREAQASLVRPKDSNGQPIGAKPGSGNSVAQMMAPRAGELSIAERIKKQDEQFSPSSAPSSMDASGDLNASSPKPLTTAELKQKLKNRNQDIVNKSFGMNGAGSNSDSAATSPSSGGKGSNNNIANNLNDPPGSLKPKKHVYKSKIEKNPRKTY